MVILLSKFDFSHVKMSNAMNLVMFMNNSWSLSLSLRQCQVNKVLGGRHHRNFLEVVVRHAGCRMHAGTGHSRNFRRREQEGLPPSGACCTSLPGAKRVLRALWRFRRRTAHPPGLEVRRGECVRAPGARARGRGRLGFRGRAETKFMLGKEEASDRLPCGFLERVQAPSHPP